MGIHVDEKLCNRDGLCVAECPVRVLRIGQGDSCPSATPEFGEMCIRCGHCVAVCPTAAFNLDWLKADECPPVRKDLALSPGRAEQFLRSRRSVRIFRSDPVERGQLEKLMEIACSAPTAKNGQPWSWIIVEDASKMAELEGLIADWMRDLIENRPEVAASMRLGRTVKLWDEGNLKLLRGAPHLIVGHVDQRWPFGPEDTALALSYAELYAPVLGLGATWAGYFYSAYNAYPPLARSLPIPEGRKVVGAMMVGRPKFAYHRLPKRNPPKIEWR